MLIKAFILPPDLPESSAKVWQHWQGHITVCFCHSVYLVSYLKKGPIIIDWLKVGGNEKQWGSGRSQMLGNGLGPWRSRFIYNLNTQLLNKNHISFSALSSKMNKRLLWCGSNNLGRAHRSSLRQWRCGQNLQRKLWTRFELADFFLVRAANLFTLRTFGAQINWRVISRKVLFDPHRFLSNKSPIHFAGESGKGNTFSMANGLFKIKMDIDRHGPRRMPDNCKNLNPPYFSLPSTFNEMSSI